MELDSALAGFLCEASDSFRPRSRSMAITPDSATRHVSQKPVLLVTLSLTLYVVPVAVKFPEALFGWLAILARTFWLMILLRGRSSRLAWVVKKVVGVGISVCLLYGFGMLLRWRPLWEFLGPLGLARRETGFWLIVGAVAAWWVGLFWTVFWRPEPN